MKRLFDVVVSFCGLVLLGPVIGIAALLVFAGDRQNPFYLSSRVGRGGRPFVMWKIRSMRPRADVTRVDTTSADDPRITKVGALFRATKIDELPQLWNVLWGDLSLVGPRPNVERETRLYTAEERKLLSVRPGITDISSIVFSDLAEIMRGKPDPNIAYNQLVRPYKSALGLLYVVHGSIAMDVQILAITGVNMISRRRALAFVAGLVRRCGAANELVEIAGRSRPLAPAPPPGASEIVTSRSAG